MAENVKRRRTPGNPSLVIVASWAARNGSNSRLLRLVRDNIETLRNFRVHTTRGTGEKLKSTGLFVPDELVCYEPGISGGVAQLAAIVARGECAATIMLLDPSDAWSDSAENRALRRVCIQREARLITTYSAAERWFRFEADKVLRQKKWKKVDRDAWRPLNWKEGVANAENGELLNLPIDQRTLALISHDAKKLAMVRFVNGHLDLLPLHQRILTTGTTGWLLRLLFVESDMEVDLLNEIKTAGFERRVYDVLGEIMTTERLLGEGLTLEERLRHLRSKLAIRRSNQFATKVLPLPSGPQGGDVIIASLVLANLCHSIIFFQDPMTAHPHDADIRLLEHTSHLKGVFAECVSEVPSAEDWINGLKAELKKSRGEAINLSQKLRRKYGLREVILVESDSDSDSVELGYRLARPCAGFFNEFLLETLEIKSGSEVRIGISWGWGSLAVLERLKAMDDSGLLEKPQTLGEEVIWMPLIGVVTSEITNREASVIADGFRRFYGGQVEGLPCGAFTADQATVPEFIKLRLKALADADIILTSASPWSESATLATGTSLKPENLPRFDEAVGLVSGIFLKEDGSPVSRGHSIVGLDLDGFQSAAQRGVVILMCGGKKRRKILRAALAARMVSSLVTTTAAAIELLE